MRDRTKKENLYRKVNTRAYWHRHNTGPDAAYDRGTSEGIGRKMTKKQRGLDYTPLYKFLLSKVGEKWDEVYSEAVSRLDKEEPIFYMVRHIDEPLHAHDDPNKGYVRMGESALYSRLYVDDDGILQKINPNINNEHFAPTCACCTWTFNGKPFVRKYVPGVPGLYNPS